MPLEPFELRAGALSLEGVDLAQVTGALEGRAVLVLSHAALAAAIRGESGPRTVDEERVGPREVLALLDRAGWWLRVRSAHGLRRARAAGFAPGRLVAGGRVKEDGFLRDVLAAGVGRFEPADEQDARNAARIAGALGHAVPPAAGAPPDLPPGAFGALGGLLAPVLRGAPALALDAPLDEAGDAAEAFALRPGPAAPGTLEGLGGARGPRPATLHGDLPRGAWALVPCRGAVALRARHPSLEPLETVLVRDGSWRLLEPVPLPGEIG